MAQQRIQKALLNKERDDYKNQLLRASLDENRPRRNILLWFSSRAIRAASGDIFQPSFEQAAMRAAKTMNIDFALAPSSSERSGESWTSGRFLLLQTLGNAAVFLNFALRRRSRERKIIKTGHLSKMPKWALLFSSISKPVASNGGRTVLEANSFR